MIYTQPCSSCRHLIFWLEHQRTKKKAPIDQFPVEGGNIEVDQTFGRYRVVPKAEREGRVDLHVNHFVTCPNAAQHHRGRAA